MRAEERQLSRASAIAARVIGPVTYIFLLARVQLIAGAVLVATLSDWAIPGSMREAMRYAVIDAPWQLPALAMGLLLVCAALRVTSEATTELVAPDLFDAPGNVGRLAHLLPRALPLGVAIAMAVPLLQLALSRDALAAYQGADQNRLVAAATGAVFIAIGVLIALLPRVRTDLPAQTQARHAGLALRLAFAVLPVAFAVVIAGTVLGLWQERGMALDALSRYRDGGVWQIGVEAVALYLACIATRLAVAIVIELVAPQSDARFIAAIRSALPRLAAFAVTGGLALEFLLANIGPHGFIVPDCEPWIIGIALGYLAIGVIAALSEIDWSAIHQSSDSFERTGRRWRTAADRLAALTKGWRRALTFLFLGALAVVVLFIVALRVDDAQAIGPIAIILLWGYTATFIFFPIAYASHMTRMPLLVLLLAAGVAFAGFDLNDNHEIRSATAAVQGQTAYREEIELGQWLRSRADWDRYEHYPIFLVATEGGGIRAAYFTAGVLAALQDRCPLFAQHVLAISGVSGGSVGAAVFAALAADRARNLSDAPCDLAGTAEERLTARARKVLSADLLSPLLGSMLFPDALQRVLPVPVASFDRARSIEHALEEAWSTANSDCASCARRMADSIGDLFAWPAGAPRPPVPHLFLNTTEAKSGRMVPFATGHVQILATPFFDRAEIDPPGLAALRQLTLQDHMTDAEASAPLSAAAILSARFPYLTPAGLIGPSGHYVDGGYFENSGTSVLAGLLQNLIGQKIAYQNPGDPALEQAVHKVVFITIVIHSEPCAVSCEVVGSTATGEDTSWNEVMSPVRALLNTREQRAELAITDLDALTALVEQLARRAAQPGSAAPEDDRKSCDELVCSVTLSFGSAPGAEVPLTWLLSWSARNAMDEAVEKMMRADVRNGTPPSAIIPESSDQPRYNTVLGSYARVLCLLAARDGAPRCGPSR